MLRIISRFAVFLAAGCFPMLLYGQSPITGRVVDSETREALAGVNVYVEGTTLGASTGRDGRFTLVVGQPPNVLIFSMLGYQARKVLVSEAGVDLEIALEPRLVDLQPIIVSASREEELRTDAPIAVATLTARELEVKKPNMLYEALNSLPGVHVTNLGNEQHTMSIRQPLSYRALFLYLEDGIPLRPPGIFNHNALIEVNMAGIDRVEVVRGPSSSLYGSNAIGGAINFISPKPRQRPGGALSVRSDNYGYRRGDFQASSTFGRLGIWAGGYAARQRGGWAEHSDFDKRSFSVRADYTFASATHLVTTLSTNHLDTDTNGSLDSLNFYRQGFTSLQTFTYRRVDATRITSRLEHVWNRRHSTDVALFGRINAIRQLPHYRIRNDRHDATAASGELNEDRFHSMGVALRHRTYLDALGARLITGASLDRSPNTFVAHYLDITRDARTGRYVDYVQRDSLLTDYAVDLVNVAAYAQVELTPIRRLKLVTSLRYDRIGYDFDNHLPPSAFSGAPDERNAFNHFSPRAGLTLDLGGGIGLYGNFSQGFLPPEVGELYRGIKVPTLKPSTFDSYEAGGWAALLSGRLHLDLSLYRMDGTNEIIAIRTEEGDTEYRNAGRTRHQGVEYGVVFAPLRTLSLRLSGTNARHTFVEYEDQGLRFDGNEMDAAPRFMMNAEVLFRPAFLPGSHVGLEWEHLGRYCMDPQNTLHYDGYDLLGLRFGYSMARGLELWMNVQNLTDTLYATIAAKNRFGQQYTPGAPRSVSLGVGYRMWK